MAPSCVNGGGATSLLRLAQVPVAEQEIVLGDTFAAALAPWQARCGEIVTAADPDQLCWRVRLTALGPEVRGVPFAFNVRVTAPFRRLAQTASSITDPGAILDRAREPEQYLVHLLQRQHL